MHWACCVFRCFFDSALCWRAVWMYLWMWLDLLYVLYEATMLRVESRATTSGYRGYVLIGLGA